MRTSKEGLTLIRHFEGFRDRMYYDAAGFPTIGYGHLVRNGEKELFNAGINEEDALVLLDQDVRMAEGAVSRFIREPLRQHQFDALVSFTFNLGSATLQRSTLRAVINRGEHAQVPEQLMRFVWAGGKKLTGLVRRRDAEAVLYAKWL